MAHPGIWSAWPPVLLVRFPVSWRGLRTVHLLAVIWTKNNPTPWNTIKPDEGTKMMAVNQKFEKRYVSSPVFRAVNADATPQLTSWSREKM